MECSGLNQALRIKEICLKLKESEHNKGMDKRGIIKGLKGAISGK